MKEGRTIKPNHCGVLLNKKLGGWPVDFRWRVAAGLVPENIVNLARDISVFGPIATAARYGMYPPIKSNIERYLRKFCFSALKSKPDTCLSDADLKSKYNIALIYPSRSCLHRAIRRGVWLAASETEVIIVQQSGLISYSFDDLMTSIIPGSIHQRYTAYKI